MTDHRGVVINTHVLDFESGNVKWKLNSFILNDTINKVIDNFEGRIIDSDTSDIRLF